MIDIKPYEGEHPFVFVSYGHGDLSQVQHYISILQLNLCYVWFDAGVDAGADWNKVISSHLKNCGAVLLFLSKKSMESDNVKNEIIAAKNINKRLIIISLDGEPYDFEWQCLLGSYNFKKFKDPDSANDKTEREAIIKYNNNILLESIPKEFFKRVNVPFFQAGNNQFYITESEVDSPVPLQYIHFVLDDGEKKRILSQIFHGGPYDISIAKTMDKDGNSVPLVDIYNVESDFKVKNTIVPTVFSIVLSDDFDYPLAGPSDLRYVLNFAIMQPASNNPILIPLVDEPQHPHTRATCMDGKSGFCNHCCLNHLCKDTVIENYTLRFKWENKC